MDAAVDLTVASANKVPPSNAAVDHAPGTADKRLGKPPKLQQQATNVDQVAGPLYQVTGVLPLNQTGNWNIAPGGLAEAIRKRRKPSQQFKAIPSAAGEPASKSGVAALDLALSLQQHDVLALEFDLHSDGDTGAEVEISGNTRRPKPRVNTVRARDDLDLENFEVTPMHAMPVSDEKKRTQPIVNSTVVTTEDPTDLTVTEETLETSSSRSFSCTEYFDRPRTREIGGVVSAFVANTTLNVLVVDLARAAFQMRLPVTLLIPSLIIQGVSYAATRRGEAHSIERVQAALQNAGRFSVGLGSIATVQSNSSFLAKIVNGVIIDFIYERGAAGVNLAGRVFCRVFCCGPRRRVHAD